MQFMFSRVSQWMICRSLVINIPNREMPVCDSGEDCIHSLLIKIINGNHVEVAQVPRGDRVPPST